MRTCRDPNCSHKGRELTDLEFTGGNPKHKRTICRECALREGRAREAEKWKNPEYRKHSNARRHRHYRETNEWGRLQQIRAHPEIRASIAERRRKGRELDAVKRAKSIVAGLKSLDIRKGYECDITIEFYLAAVQQGCFYCSNSTPELVVLDRIDNSLGHLQTNVNPACDPCNNFRKNMPYEAWLIFVPKLRQLYKEGIWPYAQAKNRRRKKIKA